MDSVLLRFNASKIILRLIGPAIFIVLICAYLDPASIMEILSSARWEYLGLAILLIPAIIMIRGLRWKWILACYHIRISFSKSCRICLISTVATSGVPMVGNFIKVFYFPRHTFGISRPLLSVFIEKYLDTAMPLGFGIAGLIVIQAGIQPALSLPGAGLLLWLFFLLFRILPGVLRTGCIRGFLQHIFRNRITPIKLRSYLLEIDHSINAKTYCVTILEFMVTSNLTMFLFVKALGIELDIASLMLVASVNSIAALIPVSYLGVGIRDVLLIGAYQFFDGNSETAVALSFIILSYHLVVCDRRSGLVN